MAKIALVTGATSGIGKATAIKLSTLGFNLIIAGRREERLKLLKYDLESNGVEVCALSFDLRDRTEVDKAIDSLSERWKAIDVLVNNAGLAAGRDTIQEGDIDNWEKMIDTNVKGLLYISRKVMPLMVNNKSGHIVNIGSTAGREVYPGGNVYCASKHAVDAISKSMRIDLVEYGIKVTQIRPGMAETEFSLVRFNGDVDSAKKVYADLEPLIGEDVAEMIGFAVGLPKHVCINDLEVTCTAQATSTIVNRK
jgi:3-hydroxy acid dehydrogenase/malonic semialdehyde reductase